MPFFTIDLDKCNKDGICVKACPVGVIQLDKLVEYPIPTQAYESYCLTCGHCVAICPTGAFSMCRISPELCPPIKEELVISQEQAEQFLRSRRSIRNFKNQPVEGYKLEKLLEIACFAPSAKNNQPWYWTVVKDQDDVRRFTEMVIDWMRNEIVQFPEQADVKGLPRIVSAWNAGQDRICRGAPHIILVHGDKEYGHGAEDSALAINYLELMAPIMGLGSCWAGYFYAAVNSYPTLFNALELPAEHRAFGAIMIGYPKYNYKRLPLRNAPRVNRR